MRIGSIHDYYPFGWEKQLTTVNAYPFNYQGQLFDRELGWQYYRYRNYDPMVARFLQVEPLIDSFPWLGYVFSENSVTYGIEMEGLELFIVHGTLQYESGHTFSNEVVEEFQKLSGNSVVDESFRWEEARDLFNDEEDRASAAIRLAAHVLLKRQEMLINNVISEDEPITLLGYSHGGNVSIQAARILGELGYEVQLITVSTPAYTGVGDAENPATVPNITKHWHIVHEYDNVTNAAFGSDTYREAYENMCWVGDIYQEYVITQEQMPVNGLLRGVDAHRQLPYRKELVDVVKQIRLQEYLKQQNDNAIQEDSN